MAHKSDDLIKQNVEILIKTAREVVDSVPMADFQSGEWLLPLLSKMVTVHENPTADYFRGKYPHCSDDEIANKLITMAEQYSVVIGTVSGMGMSLNQVAVVGSAGLMIPTVGVGLAIEMFLLTKIQLQLIYELSILYGTPLNPNNPEDLLTILAYGVGVKPIDLLGNTVKSSSVYVTRQAIRKYISKGTLKSIQKLGRAIGIKILQRSIIKYTVPFVSIAVASGFNYITTRTIGRIAKEQFQQAQEQEALPQEDSDNPIYAAALYYASVNLNDAYSPQEQAIYNLIILTDYSQDNYFQHLMASPDHLLDALSEVENPQYLLDLLKTMAICDGELSDQQTLFLLTVAQRLGLSVNIAELAIEAQKQQPAEKAPHLIATVRTTAGSVLEPIGQHIGYFGNTLQKIAHSVKKPNKPLDETSGSTDDNLQM